MQLPLQITARGVAVTPAIEADLWMAVHKLDSLYHRIMSCRVLLETVNRYGTGERIRYNVRIDLTLPGGELVVTRHPHEDLWTAVQRAFAAAQRRLQDYARRRRGEVKRHRRARRARVTQLFPYEGYGFLEASDGREIYFHRNSVPWGGFGRLEVGRVVRYAEEEGQKGPQASRVALVRRGRR